MDAARIVSLLPWDLRVANTDGGFTVYKPTGCARLTGAQTFYPALCVWPRDGSEAVAFNVVGLNLAIEGLPAPEKGDVYLVTGPVAEVAAQMGRTDVIAPGLPIPNSAGAVDGFSVRIGHVKTA